MKLNNLFLTELFKSMFVNKQTLAICTKFLQMEYIPKELPEYKKIFNTLSTEFKNTGEILSLGVVAQMYSGNHSIQEVIGKIKDSDIPDFDKTIQQLGIYIKNVRFQELNTKVYELYQQDKQEEAIGLMANEVEDIYKMSIRFEGGLFSDLFATFEARQSELAQIDATEKGLKVPFGIPILDDITKGGIDETDIALWIMRSGVGKSTVLKWTGMYAALRGHRVLHIQLEGARRDAEIKYDQIWTGEDYTTLIKGDIPEKRMVELKKLLKQYQIMKRELLLYSFETFNSASMVDIRNLIMEYQRTRDAIPELIIIDSLDLVDTGLHRKLDKDPAYKKAKLQNVAQMMKNLSVELKTRVLTATQTCDVPKDKWDSTDFVIDRSYTEGDRTLVKPFSFVFTGNRTLEEEKANVLRIFIDKFRNYNPQKRIYPIKTNYDKGRFYDHKATKKVFYDTPDKKDI